MKNIISLPSAEFADRVIKVHTYLLVPVLVTELLYEIEAEDKPSASSNIDNTPFRSLVLLNSQEYSKISLQYFFMSDIT